MNKRSRFDLFSNFNCSTVFIGMKPLPDQLASALGFSRNVSARHAQGIDEIRSSFPEAQLDVSGSLTHWNSHDRSRHLSCRHRLGKRSRLDHFRRPRLRGDGRGLCHCFSAATPSKSSLRLGQAAKACSKDSHLTTIVRSLLGAFQSAPESVPRALIVLWRIEGTSSFCEKAAACERRSLAC